MTREVVTARANTPLHAVVRLMHLHQTSCVPVVDERGRPLGIVTKTDLLETLCAERAAGDMSMRTAAEVMMPVAVTLNQWSTIDHVARMMVREVFHHVMIVDGAGALVGIVSSYDVVRAFSNDDDRERAPVA
jgi:CBS domain-containing protein